MYLSKLITFTNRITVLGLVIAFSFGISHSQSSGTENQTFDFSSSPADTGFDASVLSMTIYQGDLIVGGWFFRDGDANITGRVAGWNGTNWYPMSGLFAGPVVYDFQVVGDKLYTANAGVIVNEWNGTSWTSLSPTLGVSGSVFAAGIYDSQLVVGGSFCGVSIQCRLATWNGTGWDSLGLGVTGTVRAITEYNGDLIVAGNFSQAGGNLALRIAKWNGTSWSTLGTGFNATGVVYALTVFNSELIAAGLFDSAGGVAVSNIARWNGSSWQAMGGLFDAAYALTVHNGVLIAGGRFPTNTAYWNGIGWVSSFSPPLDSTVWTLGVYDNYLIAGGDFTTTGGGYVARWDSTSWRALNDVITDISDDFNDQLPSEFSLNQNYPNPFNPSTIIEYELPRRSQVKIEVYNINGQKIKLLIDQSMPVGNHIVEWDGTNNSGQRVSSGIYFYRVQAGIYAESKKMILVK